MYTLQVQRLLTASVDRSSLYSPQCCCLRDGVLCLSIEALPPDQLSLFLPIIFDTVMADWNEFSAQLFRSPSDLLMSVWSGDQSELFVDATRHLITLCKRCTCLGDGGFVLMTVWRQISRGLLAWTSTLFGVISKAMRQQLHQSKSEWAQIYSSIQFHDDSNDALRRSDSASLAWRRMNNLMLCLFQLLGSFCKWSVLYNVDEVRSVLDLVILHVRDLDNVHVAALVSDFLIPLISHCPSTIIATEGLMPFHSQVLLALLPRLEALNIPLASSPPTQYSTGDDSSYYYFLYSRCAMTAVCDLDIVCIERMRECVVVELIQYIDKLIRCDSYSMCFRIAYEPHDRRTEFLGAILQCMGLISSFVSESDAISSKLSSLHDSLFAFNSHPTVQAFLESVVFKQLFLRYFSMVSAD